MQTIQIGDRTVGEGQSCYVIAEIGINHNGDINLARQLVAVAAVAGCEAVKFQKRTIDVVYSQEELLRPRESPFGRTNGDLKRALELDELSYTRIQWACKEHSVHMLASCWDERSVDFIERYNPPAYKIASASVTDIDLLRHTCRTGKPIILSTGMSTLEEIDMAVDVVQGFGNQLAVLHCVATYPAADADLNLRTIQTLRDRYDVPIGYSGHERGLATSVAAVALGACIVERHITLDRAMFGSDQAASIEPSGLNRLVRDIRAVESALGDGEKRVLPAEYEIQAKLRRVPA